MFKLVSGISAILVLIGMVIAQQTRPASRTAAGSDRVEHGRYLVHHVAMCVECHTPRTERGDLVMGRLLQGAREERSRRGLPLRPRDAAELADLERALRPTSADTASDCSFHDLVVEMSP